MNILSIDTSSRTFSLCIVKNNKTVASRNIRLNKVLSDAIVPAVDSMLKKTKTPFSKIDGFAVGLGPGSFTGLRVGISTIKGFAFACQKPVVGACSLDLIAMAQAAKTDGDIAVICDAKRNMVYGRLYACVKGKIKPKTDCLLTSIEDFLKDVKNDTLFVGDGVVLFKEQIEKHFRDTRKKVFFVEEKDSNPQACFLAEAAQEKFKNRKELTQGVKPMYLYPQDCQVRR
ncbi:MAG: tRNA (adenosine(37)-N6)-threonylcarbamoyltransferase complex dimerization subunit type 1 TsaB [Candidatus Aceula meridiana]|nr:tRNA (adenosine(37)-N6)-threonylcarbamoyltransferase complex dimerization subunit type 1 TsaB [Candidatus Aceula meridiana]